MSLKWALAFAFVVAWTAAVLGYYHDRFWYAPDDGAQAHVADRIVSGEVLNRDVQDIHPGYHNLINAFALWLFGDDIVSLRYPLAAMGFIQACLMFLLLARRGPVVATVGVVASTALSLVQFFMPTAHWFSLFVFVVIVCALAWLPREHRLRLEAIGFLIVTLLLFRQLTGVIVSIGVLTYLLVEAPHGGEDGDRSLARALVVIMLLGLTGYLVDKTNIQAIILFGVWPLGLLVWAWFHVAAGNREVLQFVLRLALGGVIGVSPLMVYHLVNGSLLSWFDDTVLSALSMTQLAFMYDESYGYGLYLLFALRQVVVSGNAVEVINGLFWAIVLMLATAQGYLVLRGLLLEKRAGPALHPLPFLGVFYALVSVHFQIPVYVFYSTGITIVGVLWMTTGGTGWRRYGPVALAGALAAVALHYHAAQPLSRSLGDIFRGERIELTPNHGLTRVSVSIEAGEADVYRHLVDLIEREVPPGQTIFANPMNPELYFLTRRRNPFRFYNSGIGIVDAEDLNDALATLAREPPKLIFHRPNDKYNTAHTAIIVEFVRQHYELLETYHGFEIYRHRNGMN